MQPLEVQLAVRALPLHAFEPHVPPRAPSKSCEPASPSLTRASAAESGEHAHGAPVCAMLAAATHRESSALHADSERSDVPGPAEGAHAVPPESLPNPNTVAEALSRTDADKWQQAIDEEVAAIRAHDVWSECELPAGKQALPTRFVFEVKRDGRYKARLVAGGHRQQHGLDFEETYAPVCSYRTMRMILATVAHEDLEMRQFDIRTAFLNGKLDEEVYVRPPRGAEYLARCGRALRLWRALYGLRQASRAWSKRLEAALTKHGFKQSDADPSLWILHGEDGAVFALFYVDDGLVAVPERLQVQPVRVEPPAAVAVSEVVGIVVLERGHHGDPGGRLSSRLKAKNGRRG